MLKEQWYKYEREIFIGEESTAIIVIFQSFRYDGSYFYDIEDTAYLRMLCTEYK